MEVQVSLAFRSGEFAGQSSTSLTIGHLTNFWQCEQVPNPAVKMKSASLKS